MTSRISKTSNDKGLGGRVLWDFQVIGSIAWVTISLHIVTDIKEIVNRESYCKALGEWSSVVTLAESYASPKKLIVDFQGKKTTSTSKGEAALNLTGCKVIVTETSSHYTDWEGARSHLDDF